MITNKSDIFVSNQGVGANLFSIDRQIFWQLYKIFFVIKVAQNSFQHLYLDGSS